MIPKTKQIESKMFDLPEPLLQTDAVSQRDNVDGSVRRAYSPVIALNEESHPAILVLTGYDLNPSRMSSVTLIFQPSRNLP